MCGLSRAVPLRQLLDQCGNRSDACFECAWRVFHERYNSLIHDQVKLSCRRWNAKRLDLQYNEAVHDIALEVYHILSKNEFRNLTNFHYRDDERRFKAYLKKICQTASSYHLKKYFRPTFEKVDVEEIIMYIRGLETEISWEYYEMVAELCRASTKRRNLERDLNIFFMNVFADLSEPMIRSHPCFSGLGDRVIELAVYRVREILRSVHI